MSIQIGDISPKGQYVAAAGDVNIAFTFPIYAATDLKVYQRAAGSTPNDANDILALGADYTLAAGTVGSATGGQIILGAGATAGDIITLVRDMPQDRASIYTDGSVTVEGLNSDFSRNVMISQQNELVSTKLSPKYDNNCEIGDGDLIMDQLPAGYSWRMNATGSRIETFIAQAAAYPIAQASTEIPVAQGAHGLVIGNIVYMNAAGNYVVSQADAEANAEALGIVTVVTDAANFTLTMSGMITTGLGGLVTGSTYYLDPVVAGGITAVKPVAAGQVAKPLIHATGVTEGIWLGYIGTTI